MQFLKEAKITGNLPCLVILDINMPLMDGKETLKEIKKDEILEILPVVFFTTSSNPRDRSFSTEHGVEFVTKPANYDSIVETIKDILSRCTVLYFRQMSRSNSVGPRRIIVDNNNFHL